MISPASSFGMVLTSGIGILVGHIEKLAKDGELGADDIRDIQGCLRTIEDALEAYEKQIEEACLAAATQGRESRTEI